jgi:DNA polymerase elongation subunit (family B)
MYTNFYYNRKEKTAYVWDDIEGLVKIPYKPYAYQIDPDGDHTTITGQRVRKVYEWSQEYEKNGLVFEYDVPVATRILIDRYGNSDEPPTNHRIFYFDIEVEKGLDGYSTPKDAANKITSIAYYFKGKYVCLLLDEKGDVKNTTKSIKINENDVEVHLHRYDNETKLLMDFISHWNKVKPTITVGWNSEIFDIPYVHNRIANVLSYSYAQKLSPIGITEEKEISRRDITVKIAGISHIDYQELYKKFTYNEESSYSLEAISQKELKRGKYKYTGTLDKLFRENLDGFIEYNVTDVELMVAMDAKLDLINVAVGICHIGHVPYEDYLFSSKYLDGAALTYCRQ